MNPVPVENLCACVCVCVCVCVWYLCGVCGSGVVWYGGLCVRWYVCEVVCHACMAVMDGKVTPSHF